MLIVRGELLFGADGFLLRNAASDVLQQPLRHSVDKPLFGLGAFAERIGMPASECMPVLLAMVKDGWLSHDGDDFAAEQPFIQLSAARIGKERLSRSKAEQLVGKIVDAARSVNRDGEANCDYVTELAVFGSFLDSSKPELGDLDIGYATHRRKPFQKHEWKGWDEFWKRNPEKQALLRLKGRSPFVSIHTMKEVAELRIPHRIIYRMSEDLPELHSQLVNEA
jgi:hypothetical protein